MATWTTGSELAARYAVREERLSAYARRGDLGMRSSPNGERVYDEDRVAKLFRRRDTETSAVSLHVLGREWLPARRHLGVSRSFVSPTTTTDEDVVIPPPPRVPRLLAG